MKNRSIIIEIIVGTIAVIFFIYILKLFLLDGETTLMHDNFYGGYPVFHFFTENILNNHFPLWNPFTHGGEPFYPILFMHRLLDPSILLYIFLGQFFTRDIVVLYNWTFFLQSLVMVFGVYIFFRSLTHNLFVRLSLIPILLYSSFILVSFRQGLPLRTFIWVPFIAHFLLRIIYYKDYRWHNWLLLAGLIGLNWQAYHFTNLWVFLLLFSLGLLLFRRDLLRDLFKSRKIIPKFTVAGLIIFVMMMPNVVLMIEKDNYVYPARMIDSGYEERTPQGGPQQFEGNSLREDLGIIMPYSLIAHTGSFSSIWDFIQSIFPEGNIMVTGTDKNSWGRPSEAYMYIGLLPWAIALLGLVVGRHDLKRLWLFILLAFGLLMLGPAGGLHKLLYYIYPPLWFIRHTQSFVLLFLFAFLYFYVLGLNHVFSTWGDSLFPSNTREGFLKRLIDKRFNLKNVHNIIATILFSSSIVGFVYWMTGLEYPQTNYLFLFIIFIFVIGWVLRNDLGKKGIYTSLIVSHITLVLIFNAEPLEFIIKMVLLLGFPFGLFLLIKSRKLSEKSYMIPTLLIVFTISLIWDLTNHLESTPYLYCGQKHPEKAFNIKTTIHKPVVGQNRGIVPDALYGVGFGSQSMRYVSLVCRQPYVFSPIYTDLRPLFEVQKEVTDSVLKNNSFEDWVDTPEGLFLPRGYDYSQGGRGGLVKRDNLDDRVKQGKFSVSLTPSSVGNSMLRFHTKDIEELKDRFVKVSVWVKSENKVANGVQVDVQDGMSSVAVTPYPNTGRWEYLETVKHIDKNAKELFLSFNVNDQATAGAWFDDIKIEIGEIISDKFAKALYGKRWNSFLLLKNYFKLIHTEIPPSALKEMFAVEKPMFQFKRGIVETEEDEVAPFLRELGSDKAVQLLEEYILVDKHIDSSLTQISSADYKKIIQTSSSIKNHQDPENKKFSYSIKRYEYNSFDMETLSDKEGILYWSDGYDKKWHAYINGKEVPVYRANVNFKAVVLPSGINQIHFVYKHPLFISALLIFYGSIVVCIVIALVGRFLF